MSGTLRMEIGSPEWKKIIIDGADAMGIQIDTGDTDLFAIHAHHLNKWNQKTNLTSITDPFDIAVKHFIDSIVVLPYILPYKTVLDIGSGGGFPGLPLKIVRPDLEMTLIDGSRKKISFINHIIRTLGLQQVKAFHIRAEELAMQPSVPAVYHVILSRAFSDMAGFIEKARPLMAKGGKLIAFRGITTEKDLQSLDAVSLAYEIHPYRLPYLKAERSLVILG